MLVSSKVAICCFVGFGLSTVPAAAAVRLTTDDGTPLRWQQTEIAVALDDAELIGAALDEALGTWRRATERLPALAVQAADAAAATGNLPAARQDASAAELPRPLVRAEQESWPFDPSLLALTTYSFKVSTGEIVDADITVNMVDHCFTDDVARDSDCFDTQAVLTHELGHFFGLGHDNDDKEAAMYPKVPPGSDRQRHLSEADAASMRAVYGAGAALDEPSRRLAQTQTSEQRTTGAPSDAPAPLLVARAGCAATPQADAGWLTLAGLGLLLMRKVNGRRRPPPRTSAGTVGATALATALVALTSGAPLAAASPDEAVFIARPLSEHSYVDPRFGIVVTELELFVIDCVAGACPVRARYVVPGGRIGDVRTSAAHLPPPAQVGLYVARVSMARVSKGNLRSALLGGALQRLGDAAAGADVLERIQLVRRSLGMPLGRE